MSRELQFYMKICYKGKQLSLMRIHQDILFAWQ